MGLHLEVDGDNLSLAQHRSSLFWKKFSNMVGQAGISLSIHSFTTELRIYTIGTTAHIRKYIALQTSLGRPFSIQKENPCFSTTPTAHQRNWSWCTYSSMSWCWSLRALNHASSSKCPISICFGGSQLISRSF